MSKRAEELMDKADEIFSDGRPRPRSRVTALIDAELRKEREMCSERACKHVILKSPGWTLGTLRAAILSDEPKEVSE